MPPAFRGDAGAKTSTTNRSANAALAEVNPEGAEVDGFAIIKAHGKNRGGD